MTNEEYWWETQIVENHFANLQSVPWRKGERRIEWLHDPEDDIYFEIVQLANVTGTGKIVPVKTMFTKNLQLHRLAGPAYINEKTGNVWAFEGNKYNENEFKFFIQGMFEHIE